MHTLVKVLCPTTYLYLLSKVSPSKTNIPSKQTLILPHQNEAELCMRMAHAPLLRNILATDTLTKLQ